MHAIRTAALGLALLATLLAGGPAAAQRLIRDAETERALDMMSRPIFEAAGIPPDRVEIFILDDDRLNAFVANDSTMVLNTGLMRRFDAPAPLAGVIAHEAGHIAGGHIAQRAMAIRDLSSPARIGLILAAAAAAAAGGAPEAGAAIALGGGSALQRSLLSYTRAQEAAADQAAVQFMDRAGKDPSGLLDVLSLFKGQEVFRRSRLDPYALTHPLSSERLSLLERRIAESPARGRPPEPALAYAHARMQAKLDGFLDPPERTLARLRTEADPESEPNLYRRAIAEHRMADTDAAVATMDRLLALRPDDPFYWEARGQFLLEAARPDEAVESYRRAARLAPGEPLIRAALGRALLASRAPGSDAEAVAELERAIRDDPNEPMALRALATAYARAGDTGMAALVSAERVALTGEIAEAGALARRAMGLLPEGSPAWLRADDILALAERGRE